MNVDVSESEKKGILIENFYLYPEFM